MNTTGTRVIKTHEVFTYGDEEQAIERACLELETAGLNNLEVDTGAEQVDDNLWKVTYTFTR